MAHWQHYVKWHFVNFFVVVIIILPHRDERHGPRPRMRPAQSADDIDRRESAPRALTYTSPVSLSAGVHVVGGVVLNWLSHQPPNDPPDRTSRMSTPLVDSSSPGAPATVTTTAAMER